MIGLTAAAALSVLAATGTADTLVAGTKNPASNAKTSITQLFQNSLNYTDDANHLSALLLDPMAYNNGVLACAALSETPLTKATIQANKADLANQLNYVAYAGRSSPNQAYYIDDGVVTYQQGASGFKFAGLGAYVGQSLPFLCTQSAQATQPGSSTASASNEVTVNAAGNAFVGFRNKKSFRFLGIQYAPQPARFTYSTITNVTGQTIQATSYGPECLQYGSGSENCLFLNIQTPYLPKQGSKKNLRAVHFWIHGGGFTGGSGADPGTDGGNLASREDIVTVTINYRLSTLGFLAIPGTDILGNFGIGDQINALTWVVNNIASFGGDSSKITINGESAGAGSVRTLLGSPPAIGMFNGAIAMSNLGGGVDLGEGGNYGTTYSSYYTVAQSYAVAGQAIFIEAGCNQTALADQIQCLRTINKDLTSLPTVARYVVQDGTIVNTPELEVRTKNPNTAHINVIWGNVANDGASFVGYSRTCTSLVSCLSANLYCSTAYAQMIVDSGLFPYYNATGDITQDAFNVSQRITTDNTFRCIDQATAYAGATSGAFKSAYYYQMDRTSYGYNPNNVDEVGPVIPGFPNGDPELPYYKVHGADMPWVFGNTITYRDSKDLPSQQLSTTYFAEFMRSGQPNPEEAYLMARGYQTALQGFKKSGAWNKVSSDKGPMKRMNYPAMTSQFLDLPQCAFLNYSISYYLTGGV